MSTDRIEIYVSPQGSVYADGSRGYPVRTLQAAIRLIRQRRMPGQRAVAWLASGTYHQSETLVLTPDDSFTTFAASGPDPAIFEGAVPITGWQPIKINNTDLWVAPSPVNQARALFVGGERRPRPRFPRDSFLRIEEQAGLDVTADFVSTLFDGSNTFRYAAGDLPELASPERVEVVVPHYWLQERMPITAIDTENRVIASNLTSIFALRDDAANRFARYYLDNVAEELGRVPGEWYLDDDGSLTAAVGPQLLYVPREDETPDNLEVRLPVLDQFVRIEGDASRDQIVREVRFENVQFRMADFAEVPPAYPPFGVREDPVLPTDVPFAAEVQAASEVPGAIALRAARGCAFIDCTVEKVGGYGITLSGGSRGNLISGTRFHDLGAGAVRSGGSADPRSPEFNCANEVCDNTITAGGRIYPHCVAVLFQHGSQNVIAHNEISDFFYTGISVGWMWDYHESSSTENVISGNHIHHLGQGLLNDMGGVYLLGIAPGTVVRDNHIHDVQCANYGGWGIYLDEGSSHVVVEGNVVHDVSSQAYHHHYGRENIIRHNVWAFGDHGQVSITRPEDHVAFTFERNIVVGHGRPGFCGTPGPRDIANYGLVSDLNLFFDYLPIDGAIIAGNGRKDPETGWALVDKGDDQWQELGHDRHSLVTDPLFVDVEARDFRTRTESPASDLGIQVPDISAVGPRPAGDRRHPEVGRTRPDPHLPTQG